MDRIHNTFWDFKMNERIRELSEQAEKYALDNVGKGHYGIEDLIYQFQFVDTKMAKFAELIVAECAEVGLDSVEDGDDLDAIMKRVHNNILTHFGVEE